MMPPSTTATGRPTQPVPWVPRLLMVAGLGGVLLELWLQAEQAGSLAAMPLAGQLRADLAPALEAYGAARAWVLSHPALAGLAGAAALAAALLLTRAGLLLWHNELVARLSNTYFAPEDVRFPVRPVDLLAEIARRPPGHTFVGLAPKRRFGVWRWRPAYISARQRTMHRHVMGKTGSGKTQSVLWPQVLQDALDGKGLVFLSAKGSDEEILTIKGLAALTGRTSDLKVFSLPAWNQPELFTHTYNMVYVRPRTREDRGGDPVPMAERVFSVLDLGDNEYYRVQARTLFTNVCKLLHGMVDEQGRGLPFVMKDIAVVLKGVGNSGSWAQAVDYCLENSIDREAAEEIRSQVNRLGRKVDETFTGVVGAVDRFLAPMVNAYAPDIVFEEVLEQNLMVYVQLPANLFRLQAPALGKVILMDLQQEGSLRQVFRRTRNQRPFSVTVDEFYNFADLSIIDSLNKLRDAHLEYTLAHQSPADLELVSKEFATAVWDNTRTKDLLNQDNPELCERIAKSIGTQQVIERTVRRQQGALFTSLTTGDASSKLVEAYRLHPNAIKALERCAQGYLFNDEGLLPVAYGMVPDDISGDAPLEARSQTGARGLRLYDRFILQGSHSGRD